jgi:alanine-glyoxylate transaminase/serine-glyoxylate transaminase/serine-pyruvate transaminase
VTDHLRLMIAGPVDADDDVLAALAEPTMPHYGPQWMALFTETTELLKKLFQTNNDVLMIPGPGTSAFEMGIKSVLPVGSSICLPSNGFFGLRMKQIAEANGMRPLYVEFPMGEPVDPGVVREQLAAATPEARAAGRPIRALGLIHHETSSGVLNPLEDIAWIAREFDLILIVDAVSSLGGTRLPVDEWGIDYCVSVPNKCVGVPPGFAMASVSDRVWQLAEENPSKHSWYQDLRTWAWYIQNWGTWHPHPTTMPTNNIVALHRRLQHIFEIGLNRYIAMIAEAAKQVRDGLAEFGFELVPDPRYAAPMLSALRGPEGVDLNRLQLYLAEEHHIMISGGLAEQHGKIIRVGHMGRAMEQDYIHALLDGVRAYLTVGERA